MTEKRGYKPKKYKPELCQLLIDHMASGLSYESFGATIEPKVCRDALYKWEKIYPEFAEAKKIAKDAQELYLEKIGRAGMNGEIKNFNSAVWIFQRKNKSGWRDTVDTTLEISNESLEGFKFLEEKKESDK